MVTPDFSSIDSSKSQSSAFSPPKTNCYTLQMLDCLIVQLLPQK